MPLWPEQKYASDHRHLFGLWSFACALKSGPPSHVLYAKEFHATLRPGSWVQDTQNTSTLDPNVAAVTCGLCQSPSDQTTHCEEDENRRTPKILITKDSKNS
jgi:hypothetical protein